MIVYGWRTWPVEARDQFLKLPHYPFKSLRFCLVKGIEGGRRMEYCAKMRPALKQPGGMGLLFVRQLADKAGRQLDAIAFVVLCVFRAKVDQLLGRPATQSGIRPALPKGVIRLEGRRRGVPTRFAHMTVTLDCFSARTGICVVHRFLAFGSFHFAFNCPGLILPGY